jgi:hypothetical protein
MTKKIKFSHDYDKLPVGWRDSPAVLVGVYRVAMGWLQQMPAFLKYDTKISNSEEFYHLDEGPEGEWLLLMLIHIDTGRPFTTIRKSNPEKERYYVGSIGETFILEYTGEGN